MNIEKGKISNSQFIFLIVGFIEGSIFLVYFVSNLAQHDAWLTILSGLGVIIPFGYTYALLAKRFPGVNLARIHTVIYGPYLGTAISLLYLSYFFLILALNTKDIGDFYTNFFMRETPMEIFLMIFACVCAYAAWKGIEILARIVPFIVSFVSFIIIGTAFMLLSRMDFSNFLPIGELSFVNFIHSTQIIAEIPLGELIVFLPIAFALNDSKPVVKTFLSALVAATAFFLVITVRNTAVLGNTEPIMVSPSFQAARLIHFGFLSRLDILLAAGHTVAIFMKCTVLFYVTVLFLSQILELRTYSPMIFPLGCLAIIVGMTLYPSATEHVESTQNILTIVISPLLFIFPPLSLLIAKIRNLPQKGCL
jgi:spore germination protein KB